MFFAFRRAKVQLFVEPNRAKSNLFKPSSILWHFLIQFGGKLLGKFAHIGKILYLCTAKRIPMKRILIFMFTFISLATMAQTQLFHGKSSYSGDILFCFDGQSVYKGRSNYSGDILYTWDGKYIYKGRSNYSGDILYTWDGKYLYSGKSTYSGDIILTFDGTYIYRGKSTYSGDILYTISNGYLYRGRSNYSCDILYTINGIMPIPVLVMMIQ